MQEESAMCQHTRTKPVEPPTPPTGSLTARGESLASARRMQPDFHHGLLRLALADEQDRQTIYAIRHDVYARELRQHPENSEGRLRDTIDEVNIYIVARDGTSVAGFVAVTPPTPVGYSLDKYFSRDATGLCFDQGLYEVRLLTVVGPYRHSPLATLLMCAALRYVAARGATTVAAIGRLEILGLYERVGLQRRGLRTRAGALTYELLSAGVATLSARNAALIRRMERSAAWRLPELPDHAPACQHGGAFWDRLGDGFDTLEQQGGIIGADVLDAWFDPAPAVCERLTSILPFALKTSPPTHSEGLRRAIADTRGVPASCVLPGAGSSDLIFAGLRHWVRPGMRVLILDPMYGEYAHLLADVIGTRLDRLLLRRDNGYVVDPDVLATHLARGYDWVVLVNPNSPTGRHVDRSRLVDVLGAAHPSTRVWIDETYIEYVGAAQSLEPYAASSTQVVVCKSMSKAYALSGLRAAYLVGPASLLAELRPLRPPWAVSLPAQIAGCEALRATDYYGARWRETHRLRAELQGGLEHLGWEVTPGCANFLLCHLPDGGPDAATIVSAAAARDLFIRNAGPMGTALGSRAVRVAVKDRATNSRMLDILAEVTVAAQTHASVGRR